MKGKLYTLGYNGWNPKVMLQRILGIGESVMVYDVRFSPSSRNPEFSGKQLAAVLGLRYIHAKGLGNVDYKTDNIRLANPEPWYRDIEAHIGKSGAAVLLCACANLAVCHRLVIAQELERRLGIKVEHISPALTGSTRKDALPSNGKLF